MRRQFFESLHLQMAKEALQQGWRAEGMESPPFWMMEMESEEIRQQGKLHLLEKRRWR